jgi:hypothetical protein
MPASEPSPKGGLRDLSVPQARYLCQQTGLKDDDPAFLVAEHAAPPQVA